MSFLPKILSVLTGLLRRDRLERDMDYEMRFHFEAHTERLMVSGIPPQEAERQARIAFGNSAIYKEDCRQARGISWFDHLRSDLRFASRMLRKHPGFTLIAAVTLALGIGLNTTVFTVYNAIALRPLPVAHPSEIVRIERVMQDGSRSDQFSYTDFEQIRVRSQSFSGVAALLLPSRVAAVLDRKQEQADAVQVRFVSGNYFAMLDVNARSGRTFAPEEDLRTGFPAVAVLSHRFWSRRYQSDPNILGKTLTLNGIVFTIVGVMPEKFAGTGAPALVPDLWAPLGTAALVMKQPQAQQQVQLLARRKPGSTLRQSQNELGVMAGQLEAGGPNPSRTVKTITARPATFFDTASGEFDTFVLVIAILLAAVTVVLLIGCVNLVNLLLARAATRSREIAVRAALGASGRRIVSQLCTESALLGLLGGTMGLALAALACSVLSAQLERKLLDFGSGAEYLFVDVSPDLRVFLYTAVLSIITGILVGLAPARHAARIDVNGALKEETPGGTRSRFRDILISLQVAACLCLLIGAGLLCQGVLASSTANPGFETRRVYMLPAASREIRRRIEALPQIESVTVSNQYPLMGHNTGPFAPQASPLRSASRPTESLYNMVSERYFETLRIPIVRGRAFRADEVASAAPVVVINEETARKFWPGEDSLGKRIVTLGYMEKGLANRSFTVIGVARSVRSTNLSRVDPSYLYFPVSPADSRVLLLRTNLAAGSITALIRRRSGPPMPSLPAI